MSTWSAFDGFTRFVRGAPGVVALAVNERAAAWPGASILVFDDETGAALDLDLRGTEAEIAARYMPAAEVESTLAPRPRGRPKLGVIAREVTLLPRHWEWLAAQRGGASHALRRLVDEARRADGGRSAARAARDGAYRFMAALGGDLPGFEEASRALFAGDRARLEALIGEWPGDIGPHTLAMAWPDA